MNTFIDSYIIQIDIQDNFHCTWKTGFFYMKSQDRTNLDKGSAKTGRIAHGPLLGGDVMMSLLLIVQKSCIT